MTNQPHSPAEYNGRYIDESSKPKQCTKPHVDITTPYYQWNYNKIGYKPPIKSIIK